MMDMSVFLLGLMIVSALTGLVTEAVKKVLTEHNVNYRANTLAGIVATIVSAAVGAGYIVMTNTAVTAQVMVVFAALIVMGWLCAMVGYDKVIQTISQLKTIGKDE